MIILQAMSILVLLLILILVYSAIHKMLKEHKEKYSTDTDQTILIYLTSSDIMNSRLF